MRGKAIRTLAFELEELNLKCQGYPLPSFFSTTSFFSAALPLLRSPCCAVVWIKIIKQALF